MDRKTFFIVLLIFPFIFSGDGSGNIRKNVIKPSEFKPNIHWRYKAPSENYNPPPLQYWGIDPIEDIDYLA